MYLYVNETIEFRDPDNFTDLHVECPASSRADLGAALGAAEWGAVTGDHAWLTVSRLRAAGPDDDQWRTQFDGMIAYARSKGWLDESGARVRAHVVSG